MCVSAHAHRLPMQVAIALGLVLAELSPDPWHGRMITFSATPQWFVVPNTATSLAARVAAVQAMPWNTTTNFHAALELVLTTAVANNTPQDAMPQALFVVCLTTACTGLHTRLHCRSCEYVLRVCVLAWQLTDMQFDAATGAAGFDPHASATIQRRFMESGYNAPHIVFWNLRAAGPPIFQVRQGGAVSSKCRWRFDGWLCGLGMQAEADTPGVSFMSGFSPQVLTDFMESGVLGSGPEAPSVTPWETLSARLARPRLDAVRALVARVQEGPMAGYVPPERGADADADGTDDKDEDAMKAE